MEVEAQHAIVVEVMTVGGGTLSLNEINVAPSVEPRPSDAELEACVSAALSDEQRRQMLAVLVQHRCAFAADAKVPQVSDYPTPPIVDTGDAQPVFIRRHVAPAQAAFVRDAVRQLEAAGLVSRQASPWNSPVVVVTNANGKQRLVLDYRRVNELTKKRQPVPPPVVDDVLRQLGNDRYFAVLDAAAGYFQLELHESDRPKSAFTTDDGQFVMNRVPLGLCNAPSAYAEYVAERLRAHIESGDVLVYFDDMLIRAKTFERLIAIVSAVLSDLAARGPKINVAKCRFGVQETKFLGFMASSEGIYPDPARVAAILSMQRPTTIAGNRRALGLFGVFRRHIPRFAERARPLTQLLAAGPDGRVPGGDSLLDGLAGRHRKQFVLSHQTLA